MGVMDLQEEILDLESEDEEQEEGKGSAETGIDPIVGRLRLSIAGEEHGGPDKPCALKDRESDEGGAGTCAEGDGSSI